MIDGVNHSTQYNVWRNGGIVVPSDVNIVMDYDTVIKVIPNNSWETLHSMLVGRLMSPSAVVKS